MEKRCALCKKGGLIGGKRKLLRGHYNPTKTVRRKPNLQRLRLPFSHKGFPQGLRLLVCTRCMKAMSKKRK